MNTVTLITANNKRLHQLCKEHGGASGWEVLSTSPWKMQCFNGELGIHVRSPDGEHRRNVRMSDVSIDK